MKKTFNQFPEDLDQAIHLRAYHDGITQQELVITVLKSHFARELQVLKDSHAQALLESAYSPTDTNPESLDRPALSDER